MHRFVIRGGTVIDGSGGPPRRADVSIQGGRIREIGGSLDVTGARVLDAVGAVVTPGFIDVHTHLDPAMFWDPLCDPMPQHGVTTAFIGNCSLSLAPVRPDRVAEVSALFSYIEDIPVHAFESAIPWCWESYAQYREEITGRGLGVHAAALLGHSMLRLYVMGDEAWERAATPTEAAAMAEVLDRAMAAGAFGFSTSFFDEDVRNRPVPCRLADDAELHALLSVLQRCGRGLVQAVPGLGSPDGWGHLDRLAGLCGDHGVTLTFTGLTHSDLTDRASRCLALVRSYRDAGIDVWPQTSPRPLELRVDWEPSMVFMRLTAGWHAIPNAADDATRRRLLTDPQWRATARTEWDRVDIGLFPTRHLDRVRLFEVSRAELEPWVGRSLAELVDARGGHPSDVLADWVLDNDLRPGVATVIGNADADGVAGVVSDPLAMIGGGDAGAHVQMMCAAGDTTLLLTRHVRDRGDLTLEAAVHHLTGRPANAFGLRDRGRIAPGLAADLTVFSLDELDWAREVQTADLPGGAKRLRRPPGGYRYTMAAGVLTQEAGVLTGARPAGMLHSADG